MPLAGTQAFDLTPLFRELSPRTGESGIQPALSIGRAGCLVFISKMATGRLTR